MKTLKSMQHKDIIGDYQTVTYTHYDGIVRDLLYTDIETKAPKDKKIISVTNPLGIITNVNKAFIEISGYKKDELMGAPHYITHHPDMPKAAFNDMWDSLGSKGSWKGYVKNLRKDGGYYWVFAMVVTLRRKGEIVGYTSSRERASSEDMSMHIKRYNNLPEY